MNACFGVVDKYDVYDYANRVKYELTSAFAFLALCFLHLIKNEHYNPFYLFIYMVYLRIKLLILIWK